MQMLLDIILYEVYEYVAIKQGMNGYNQVCLSFYTWGFRPGFCTALCDIG
jgi:hypothetical protein